MFHIAVDLLFGWLLIGSLHFYVLATIGVVDLSYAGRVGRFRRAKIAAACLMAIVLWPKLLRKLLEHPRWVGKRLARNLWGRR